jgi:ATP-binding cassette, subfamily G (WHITE), member 2, PDR
LYSSSVTNPRERQPREGFEGKVPRTAEEFEKYWLESSNFKAACDETDHAEQEEGGGEKALEEFRVSHHQMQADHVRPKSPYVISIPMQIRVCVTRAYQRIWNDKASTM